jgi:hypothetical protein
MPRAEVALAALVASCPIALVAKTIAPNAANSTTNARKPLMRESVRPHTREVEHHSRPSGSPGHHHPLRARDRLLVTCYL